jgi:hypothetical protein
MSEKNELNEVLEAIGIVVTAIGMAVPQAKLIGHLDGLVEGRKWPEGARQLVVLRALVPGYQPKK